MQQIDRLIRAVRAQQNPTALGLDTRIDYLPESFAAPHLAEGGAAEAIYAFNAALLRELRDIVPCVKVQAAYYELLGTNGFDCLRRTLREAQRLDYVVILDAKRGDIGATAAAYSAAYLGPSAPTPADFLTVNPYLGSDGIEPFVADCAQTGRGIFALVKTSNPSSGEFQDMKAADGLTLFEHVGRKVSAWGQALIGDEGYSAVGAVVGATYPEQGRRLRAAMPQTFFLIPGYGAQGATATDLAGCFDASGGGGIVNASRSIICAHKKTGTADFAAAARVEALRMKDDLTNALKHGMNSR